MNGSDTKTLAPIIPEKTVGELAAVEARAISKFAEASVLEFTEREREILSRPVPTEQVLTRPDGLIYLDWGYYANTLDEAFGKGNWSLTPAPWSPKLYREGNITYREYCLWIRGQFAANAVGHHEEQRKTTNFGDAAEATWANALTRCAKHLGVARDLWRKQQIERIKREMKAMPRSTPTLSDIVISNDLEHSLRSQIDGASDIKTLKDAWDVVLQWKSKLSAEDFASLEKLKNNRKTELQEVGV